MNAKRIITIVLLLFVGVSLAYVVIRPFLGVEPPESTLSSSTTQPARPDQVTVTYFLIGPKRCEDCRRLEVWTREAVELGFPGELEEGKVVFRTINTDLPAHRHCVKDYGLTTKTVVVARGGEGAGKNWRRLDSTWDMYRRDRGTFTAFIQDEVRAMLDREPRP